MGEEAIELFRRTPKELINEAAVICVLNACSHGGLVEQGLSIFKDTANKSERIFTTMVRERSLQSHTRSDVTCNHATSLF